MKQAVIVDTNVPITANGRANHASNECEMACIIKLRDIFENNRVSIDISGLILYEYRRNLSPNGQPGVGDAFFKWIWDNQANPEFCTPVQITPTEDDRKFEEFPDDPDLARFDPSDRKFVAVALANPEHPVIINAVDTDWLQYQDIFALYGVTVEHICKEDLCRFAERNKD